MNALLLALVLAIPAAPAATAQKPARALTDAQVRSQVQAYLGSIDTAIPAARWQALGARAEPELTAVINGEELPTRRAKAIDGLAAISTARAPALFTKLATDDSQPLNVRYAALRGLGRVLPESKLLGTMQPILEKSADIRIRAKAGEELARRAPQLACTVLRAQVARETAESKAQFDRAREGCLGH